MIPILTFATLAVVLIIVLVVAYHLIGIYVALKRGADHLEALAGGLVAIRDNTAPLNSQVDEVLLVWSNRFWQQTAILERSSRSLRVAHNEKNKG